MNKVISLVKSKMQFYKDGMWKLSPDEEKEMSSLDKFVKLLICGTRKFMAKNLMQQASALTYFSLLSVVPVVAMVFGVAKGFGFDKMLEEILMHKFADKKDILLQVFDFANSLLANTHGGMIAGIGLLVLFWSVMKVLGNIEGVLNDIWDVKTQRSPARKLSDYFSIMLLAPVLLILSNSATIYISSFIHDVALKIHWTSSFEWFITFGLKIIPFSLVWFGLAFIYMIMPNTKVKFKPAFIGGVTAGIIFQIVQWVYIRFQVGVASYNAIYGSFAALPLFLVWLQTSWFIVMFGAVISNAVQNGFNAEFENEEIILSHEQKLTISLWLAYLVAKNFEKGGKPMEIKQISRETGMSHYLVKFTMKRLELAQIVTRVYTTERDIYMYQPAITTNKISVQMIEENMDKLYEQRIVSTSTDDYLKIKQLMNSRREILHSSPVNVLMKEI